MSRIEFFLVSIWGATRVAVRLVVLAAWSPSGGGQSGGLTVIGGGGTTFK